MSCVINHNELRDVYLHGALGEEFGRHFRLAVKTPAEAFRALMVNFKEFRQKVVDHDWRVIRGDKQNGIALGEESLSLRVGNAPLHLVPVIKGSRGLGKAIIGTIIAASAFFFAGPAGLSASLIGSFTYGNLFALRVGLALTGVSQMLSPTPSLNNRENVDQRKSFIFEGAENVAGQGGAVPVVCGQFRVGSVVGSVGLFSERLAIESSSSGSGKLS